MTEKHTLQFKSSRCMDSEGRTISKCVVYEPFYIEVVVENTLRKQIVTNIIKVVLHKKVIYGLDEKVSVESRVVTVPPLEVKVFVITLKLTYESDYYYIIHIADKMVKTKLYPYKLYVHKKDTALFLNEPSTTILEGTTAVFTGKLVNTSVGEGVAKAKIHIYHIDIMGNKFMVSGTTKDDGTFCIEWTAQKIYLLPHIGEIYAKFEGDDVYKPSRSDQFAIKVTHLRSRSRLIDLRRRRTKREKEYKKGNETTKT